jgi:TonB family protein
VPKPPPDEKDIPEPEKPKPPKEEPKPKPPAPKPPKPEPKKPNKIEVSKKLVRRQPTSQRRSKLTAEELQRLLDRGARTGSKATLSDDDLRRALNSDMRFSPGNPMSQELLYLEMVRQALYKSWNQPASLGVAGLVTQMEITVQPNGTILGSRVLAGSGNRVMDDSVVRAVQSVRRIYGVPASFFEGHRRIRVAFELTGD